jgi:hypothetical protein
MTSRYQIHCSHNFPFLISSALQSFDMVRRAILLLSTAWQIAAFAGEIPRELRVGVAGHAFDHLGNIGEQSEAAVASGLNIIYATGLGAWGYQGIPPEPEWSKAKESATNYNRDAKRQGIKLSIGYICATSIVTLKDFDRGWTTEFRAQFKTPPSDWLQRDRNGQPLPSWYGGDYRPACMNNADWLAYEKAIVRASLEAGCDGIFFDNPTVHQQGCYCHFCMERFFAFLNAGKERTWPGPTIEELRRMAVARPEDFRRFRTTIARDFFAEIRSYARTINPHALVTANNSLNSAEVLYSQARGFAYSIFEMSKTEDFVVVEDMSSQPRTLANGRIIEYGPTYKQLNGISHGKPVVAVTIADTDYHTAPNLVRLAMAEAAANGSSYLAWPTWPEKERARMSAIIRPQADLLRANEKLLNDTQPRNDVVLFLPNRRWLETDKCRPSEMAAALSAANVQYTVMCEDDFANASALHARLKNAKVLVAESRSVFKESELKVLDKWLAANGLLITADKGDWLKQVQSVITSPSLKLTAPASIRAVVHDQGKRTIVHLLNLNVQKLSSFEDKVTPVTEVCVSVRLPFKNVHSVRALTADANGTSGALKFTTQKDGKETIAEFALDKLEIATIVVCE